MKMKLLAAVVAASTLAATSANAEVKVTTKGGLKVTSGDYEFKFGGRIQYDYDRTDVSLLGTSATTNDDFDIRRARLFVSGNISKNWKFKAQFNLDGDGGNDNVEDLYLRYTGWGKAANVTIGNQKQPFGLEEQTSSKDISFLERSSLTELFAPGRAEGVQLHGKLSGNQTYGIGVYFDDEDTSEVGEELGFAARYTIAPVKTDSSVFHLGLGYNTIEERDVFGVEAAYAGGPFHVQAEYMDGEIDDVDSDGFYVQFGYILTGETRPYSGGKFKRVNPNSKSGAWEIVARYEDGNGRFSDIGLGSLQGPVEASSYGLGVNYYAHKNVRIGASYNDGDIDGVDISGDEFRVRFQLTF